MKTVHSFKKKQLNGTLLLKFKNVCCLVVWMTEKPPLCWAGRKNPCFEISKCGFNKTETQGSTHKTAVPQ